jgi:hypothetical protein
MPQLDTFTYINLSFFFLVSFLTFYVTVSYCIFPAFKLSPFFINLFFFLLVVIMGISAFKNADIVLAQEIIGGGVDSNKDLPVIVEEKHVSKTERNVKIVVIMVFVVSAIIAVYFGWGSGDGGSGGHGPNGGVDPFHPGGGTRPFSTWDREGSAYRIMRAAERAATAQSAPSSSVGGSSQPLTGSSSPSTVGSVMTDSVPSSTVGSVMTDSAIGFSTESIDSVATGAALLVSQAVSVTGSITGSLGNTTMGVFSAARKGLQQMTSQISSSFTSPSDGKMEEEEPVITPSVSSTEIGLDNLTVPAVSGDAPLGFLDMINNTVEDSSFVMATIMGVVYFIHPILRILFIDANLSGLVLFPQNLSQVLVFNPAYNGNMGLTFLNELFSVTRLGLFEQVSILRESLGNPIFQQFLEQWANPEVRAKIKQFFKRLSRSSSHFGRTLRTYSVETVESGFLTPFYLVRTMGMFLSMMLDSLIKLLDVLSVTDGPCRPRSYGGTGSDYFLQMYRAGSNLFTHVLAALQGGENTWRIFQALPPELRAKIAKLPFPKKKS